MLITNLEEKAVIVQQIALNKRMFEGGKISQSMYSRAQKILAERLTSMAEFDMIADENVHSKVM